MRLRRVGWVVSAAVLVVAALGPGTAGAGPNPSWTSVSPHVVAVGGTVAFSGDCGTANPGPTSWDVHALDLGGGGLYTSQGDLAEGTFAPGSTGTFSGTVTVPDAAHTTHSPYYLYLSATCFWPVPPYTANTPTNWYALGSGNAVVNVGGLVIKFTWQYQLQNLLSFGLGQIGTQLGVGDQLLIGKVGPPASTTTTTTTKPNANTTTTTTTTVAPTTTTHATTTTTCSARQRTAHQC